MLVKGATAPKSGTGDIIDWLIEQFSYVTFWHSKLKTDPFIKYHIQVYDLKYTITKASV